MTQDHIKAMLNDRILYDGRFQAACQRYAHENGSSMAIAAAARAALGDDFATALALDPEGLIAVIDLARQIWEGEELAAWMLTPQARWQGRSPLEMCSIQHSPKSYGSDDVLDALEQVELP